MDTKESRSEKVFIFGSKNSAITALLYTYDLE